MGINKMNSDAMAQTQRVHLQNENRASKVRSHLRIYEGDGYQLPADSPRTQQEFDELLDLYQMPYSHAVGDEMFRLLNLPR